MDQLQIINELLVKEKEEKPKKINGRMVLKGYKAPKKVKKKGKKK